MIIDNASQLTEAVLAAVEGTPDARLRRITAAAVRHLHDVQFGVTRALVGRYVMHENEAAPAPDVQGRWYSLEHTFVIAPGDDALPPPPITAKTEGPRPPLAVLRPHPSPPPDGAGARPGDRQP